MKRLLYTGLVLVLLVLSFGAGSWYRQREVVKSNGPGGKAQPLKSHDQSDDQTSGDMSSMPPGTVKITPQKQQMIGVQVGAVERVSETHGVRTLGRVTPDENRVYRLLAATDGWMGEVYGSTTGSLVQKDQLMATYYINEFYGRQQQYFFALDYRERLKQQTGTQQSGAPPPVQLPDARYIKSDYGFTRDQLQLAKQELLNLGVGEHQLQEMARTKQYATHIEIRSPVSGLVLARNLSPRQKVERNTEFFRIAELSRVWIVADVFGREAQSLRPGMSAKISLPDQGKIFQAKVSDVLPQVDTATRALKVRLETDNPENVLRPGMFVDVEFLVAFPRTLTVPADAVLDSGLRKTVFVALEDGFFEPRTIETGRRFGNRVEIVEGLKPGEKIVVSGTFLIDSESRLELAAAGMVGTLSKDPVCSIDVSVNKAEKAGRKSSYRGKPYYFTSDECKEQFDKNPDRYATKP